jgi:ABC-2 type transport system permease protein
MSKVWLVAQREFMENVRTKSFWIGILFLPLILAVAIVVPNLLDSPARQFAVLDRSGWVLDAIGPAVSQNERFELVADAPQDEAALNRMVADEEMFAYFVVGPDPMTGSEGARYISRNLTDSDLERWFQAVVSATVRGRRLDRENIDPGIAQWIQQQTEFEAFRVTKDGELVQVEDRDRIRQIAPIAFVYLLWISIFTIAQMLLTNTVEEKSNRLMEVLLSSVSPVQLMAGKIAGIAMTGLTVISTWVLAFIVIIRYVPRLLGAGPEGLDLTPIVSDPIYLASFVVYFILGYLFYAALLVGIGSVCNTLKEAQNLMMPVMLFLLVPLMTMVPIGQDPNGTLARVLSFVPPFTPFVMMNRAAGPPSQMEYLVSGGLLLLSIGAVLWLGAKIFRVGILMTGKPPTLRDMLRWVRTPVGAMPVVADEV